MKIFFFFVGSSALVFVATVFFRLGGYKSVDVQLKKYPALYLVYQEKLGPYHEIEGAIEQVESWAREHHLACDRTFGEFLDDPRTADERRLRSHVGCVLTSPLEGDVARSVAPFVYEARPEKEYVLATFDGAPSIGPLKVYPKVRAFLTAHGATGYLPSIEIYTVHGDVVLTEYLTDLQTTKKQ